MKHQAPIMYLRFHFMILLVCLGWPGNRLAAQATPPSASAAAPAAVAATPTPPPVQLAVALEFRLGQELGQMRAAPVQLGSERGLVVAYAGDFDIDPYHEMFFYPKDTLKIAVYDLRGGPLWEKDLGRGLPPGMWFCPVFPFDLDGDGVDEIWHVGNPDVDHPFAISKYRLERLDARTGKSLGSWPWPRAAAQPIAHMFRNFILGGRVHGQPVLVTAQGTYGVMTLQAWNPDMSRRWEHTIPLNSPGARGSHMTPIVDFDGDGIDEVMWGERRIELDKGKELFCADRAVYKGHSDVIQPFLEERTGQWRSFTCRESDLAAKPRIVVFDHRGERQWGALDFGHIDMGWVAHLHHTRDFVAMGIRIGQKTLGPTGRFRTKIEEFVFNAVTGEPMELPFKVYETLPVDLNGDGVHELVYGHAGASGDVIDGQGRRLGNVGGTVSFAAKLLEAPGEHLVVFTKSGTVRIWRDTNAHDSAAALRRYAHPFYRANVRLTATASNHINLGGL
jgi:hypothetical protein